MQSSLFIPYISNTSLSLLICLSFSPFFSLHPAPSSLNAACLAGGKTGRYPFCGLSLCRSPWQALRFRGIAACFPGVSARRRLSVFGCQNAQHDKNADALANEKNLTQQVFSVSQSIGAVLLQLLCSYILPRAGPRVNTAE
jgi:hypothetical protein